MRVLTTSAVLFLLAGSLAGQQRGAAPPAQTDRTKASHMMAADLSAALAKLPTDRPVSSVRVFTLAPYAVNVERRPRRPAILDQSVANWPVSNMSTRSPGESVLTNAASHAPVPEAG